MKKKKKRRCTKDSRRPCNTIATVCSTTDSTGHSWRLSGSPRVKSPHQCFDGIRMHFLSQQTMHDESQSFATRSARLVGTRRRQPVKDIGHGCDLNFRQQATLVETVRVATAV